MKCHFCGSDKAEKAYSPYTWTFSDGRTIKLLMFKCGSCGMYYVTNPETGVFVAVQP